MDFLDSKSSGNAYHNDKLFDLIGQSNLLKCKKRRINISVQIEISINIACPSNSVSFRIQILIQNDNFPEPKIAILINDIKRREQSNF